MTETNKCCKKCILKLADGSVVCGGEKFFNPKKCPCHSPKTTDIENDGYKAMCMIISCECHKITDDDIRAIEKQLETDPDFKWNVAPKSTDIEDVSEKILVAIRDSTSRKEAENFLRTTLQEVYERGYYKGEKNEFQNRVGYESVAFKAGKEAARGELRSELEGMKKEQLDKNDPDNYGACYAIAGFNDALSKVSALLSPDKLKEIEADCLCGKGVLGKDVMAVKEPAVHTKEFCGPKDKLKEI